MNPQTLLEVKEEAEKVAKIFNDPSRDKYSGEQFYVDKVIPCSDDVAIVNFRKMSERTGQLTKYAQMVFVRVYNHWKNWFPKYDHYVGLSEASKLLPAIEKINADIVLKQK